MNQAMTLPIGLTVTSEASYLRAVNQFAMLDAAEEQALARRFRDAGDLDAARQLVLSHLRFVARIARGYAGYGLAQGDLIQEGNIGLMKAVKRFDPEIGVRLVSFAVHWIRAEIHEFILRNWRIVRIATTKAQRKLFFNLRRAKQRLGWLHNDEVEAVASDLGVSPDEVRQMEERLSAYDASFDASGEDTADDAVAAPVNYLQDLRFNPEEVIEAVESESVQAQRLEAALAALDARSRDIVVSRWLAEPKKTLHDLAAYYEVSAERIRQIESNALAKLRASMT